MRVDELQQGLASVRESQLAADAIAGRQGVDRRVRRHRVQRAGLAVVVVAVLAGAGLFVATRGTDEQRVISGPDPVPHYLPDPVLNGGVLFQEYPARAQGSPSEHRRSAEWAVWTNDLSGTPREDSQMYYVSVIALDLSPATNPLETKVDERTVRMSWVDAAGNSLALHGIGVPLEEVEATQPSVVIDATGNLAMEAPVGFREVARQRRHLRTGAVWFPTIDSVVADPDEPGYVAAFEDTRYPRTAFSAALMPPSIAWHLAVQYQLQPAEVRGRPAYRFRRLAQRESASIDGAPSTTQIIEIATVLIWWETDEVVLTVQASTEPDARALAESMREVSDAEWDRFVATTRPFGNDNESTRNPASGTGSATTVR